VHEVTAMSSVGGPAIARLEAFEPWLASVVGRRIPCASPSPWKPGRFVRSPHLKRPRRGKGKELWAARPDLQIEAHSTAPAGAKRPREGFCAAGVNGCLLESAGRMCPPAGWVPARVRG